ncbi:MAG TPA: cupin domain-containing protein [Exilispira sp.]|nr:cupin domain-containing protein [Exilispira sp.]
MNIYTKDEKLIPFEKVTMDGAKDTEYKVVVGKKEGAENFIMRIFRIQPGGHSPLHSHEWEHENYFLRGSGEIRNSKGESIKVKQGDVAFIPPFEEHQYFNSGEDVLEFICLIPIVDR